jgi:ABC-2 type transport system permease protein
MVVAALIRKELTLLLRDWHALALLFLMPAAFILVMSLALQDRFAADQGVSISYYLLDEDSSPASQALTDQLAATQEFKREQAIGLPVELQSAVRHDRVQFLLMIPKGFGATLGSAQPKTVELESGPSVEPALSELFAARLHGLLTELYLQQRLAPLGTGLPDTSGADALLHTESLYTGGARPSSVQQNVPAWLLFAMFFIAIPLSTTWVQERQQGTYARLRSMGVKPGALLLGKLLPYLAITLVQVVLMLAVGVWIVPLLGGGQLSLGHAPLALALVSVAAGFAAVSYALLVANLVSTAEQATIFTGVTNLLMAAVGGIMVPRFIMPTAMQAISLHSPMAWGLEGFLDVFLRQGGILMVVPEVLRLAAFGVACLLLAGLALRLRRRR